MNKSLTIPVQTPAMVLFYIHVHVFPFDFLGICMYIVHMCKYKNMEENPIQYHNLWFFFFNKDIKKRIDLTLPATLCNIHLKIM